MTDTISVNPPSAIRTPQSTSPLLTAAGIRKTFRMGDSDLTILKNVDLAVAAGEFVAIEGRSGSGKSSLLHLLGCLDEATAGTVSYEGVDIQSLGGTARSRLRNRSFGFVFQFYHLLPELSVLENTMLAAMIEYSWLAFRKNKDAHRKRASELLDELGMGHRLTHRPAQLSGGERQRVAIARALMNNPKIVFADEPTGNLDYETGGQIMAVLERLHREQGQTIVMVTHDRTIARKADRLMVLKEGRLQSVGE